MMKPKTTIRLAPGNGSRWTGWQKKIDDQVDQLEAEVEGLSLRFNEPARPGIPSSYRFEKTFEPESAAILVDTAQDGVSSNPVNYVVRDGQPYNIPCVFNGDGVFVARFLKVAITQRIYVTPYASAVFMACPQVMQGWNDRTNVLPNLMAWTTKFSVFPRQPQLITPFTGNTSESVYGAVNYVWNLRDDRSMRYLSSDYMSSVAQRPGSVAYTGSPTLHAALPDGGLYEFDTPKPYERDGQATFIWYPVTPIYQFDSSLAGTDPAVGLTYDDRENGKRHQPVTVAVEFHGYKYLTTQDAIGAGALTRNG